MISQTDSSRSAVLFILDDCRYGHEVGSRLRYGYFVTAAVLMKAALSKLLRLSVIDGVIVAFTVWCLAISVIYYEGTKTDEVAKLLVLMLSYTLVKNVVPDQRGEYTRSSSLQSLRCSG